MINNPLSILLNYKFSSLKNDLVAGISVAILALPQNMAYALVAGVDPIYGLYTSIVSLIVSTFFGNSDYMVVGPTNITSLALYSNLSNHNLLNSMSYFEGVLLLTFLVGVIQIIFGFLKLGNLVSYISQSVITGLTTGVAVIILVGQLDNFLGLDISGGVNIFESLYLIMLNIDQTNYYSLLLGLITIFLIIKIKKSSLKIPAYLAAIGLAMLIVFSFSLQTRLPVVSQFSASLPQFNLINLELRLIPTLVTSAVSIAILGFIQVISIIKFMNKKTGQDVDLNKEFVTQGIMNISCSFFSSFVSAGSFTKTFANYSAGAKSRISQLFTALSFIIFIYLFNFTVQYIPISSLAALILIVAASMIDFSEIKKTFLTTRFDAIVFSATFLTTLIAPRIDYAIYLGMLISIGLLLEDNSQIDYSHIQYDQEKEGTFSRRTLSEVKEDDCIIINLAGELHFNASENLKQNLNNSYLAGKKFVLRIRNVEAIDLTVIEELDKFITKVKSNGGEVFLSGMDEQIFRSLAKFGIISKIGEENIYWAKDHYFTSTQKAVEEAIDNNSN